MKTLKCLAALALAAALIGGFEVGSAQARSPSDCEKIEAWDAYNKCLAEFGPKRGGAARVAPMSEQEAVTPTGPRTRSIRGSRSARAGGFVRRTRSGRAFAVFDVSPSPRPRRR
ncbi:hypothetical protein [Terrarubrum flagellatum]|uniref:hypothetical protein n=1 Tax=Terrirubrum flagellatum TaxID=2895980 RepID=UPI0031454B0D